MAFSWLKALYGAFSVIVKSSWTFVSSSSLLRTQHLRIDPDTGQVCCIVLVWLPCLLSVSAS